MTSHSDSDDFHMLATRHRDDAWEPDDYPRTSPSPYGGLRTQWLIVVLGAVVVGWVVAAVLRA
jgi:hypothetical protein